MPFCLHHERLLPSIESFSDRLGASFRPSLITFNDGFFELNRLDRQLKSFCLLYDVAPLDTAENRPSGVFSLSPANRLLQFNLFAPSRFEASSLLTRHNSPRNGWHRDFLRPSCRRATDNHHYSPRVDRVWLYCSLLIHLPGRIRLKPFPRS